MATVLRLIYGDKQDPTRTLDLNPSGKKITLRDGGFAPGPGSQSVQWATGSIRQDGARRVRSGRDNAVVELVYDLYGDQSRAELAYWQREVNRFALECGLYEEDRAGRPVWVEYRWDDGLEDLPAPVFGQFSHYLPVYQIEPAWPRGGPHTELLQSSYALQDVLARLVVGPYPEGLRQLVGTGQGQLELTDYGVASFKSATNKITNPSFGHSTWDTGWGVSGAALKAEQETRATRSLDSAARLSNTAGAARQFTQSLTLTVATYYISCYARNLDGSAVTSSDIQLWGQGAVKTTSFVSVGGGWYFAYASFTGAAAASTHGVQVKTDKAVVVDDFMLQAASVTAVAYQQVRGDKLGCSWAGTAHNSESSSGADGQITYVLTDEFSGLFTAEFWLTPLFESTSDGAQVGLFGYRVDANNQINVSTDLGTSPNVITITHTLGGSASSDTSATVTFAPFTPIHFAVVQDATGISLYVNGALDGSLAITVVPYLPTAGTLTIGGVNGLNPVSGFVDGFRVWDQALSAAQVLALYNAEEPIKTDGGLVGTPPYLWTKDGDDVLDNVDDSTRDCWGVVGGLAGDVPAYVRWVVQPPTATPELVYWLGRKATQEAITPATFYGEFQGTVDGNSSGGEYEELAAGTSDYSFISTNSYSYLGAEINGRYQMLGRFYVATNQVEVKPGYHFGTADADTKVYGDAKTIGTNANFLWRDFGDITIRKPNDGDELVTTSLRLELFVDRTASATVRLDFFVALPHPMARVGAPLRGALTISAGEQIVIENGQAFTVTTDGQVQDVLEYRGDDVTLEPGRYNYVFFLQGQEATQYDVTDTATLTIYVTPRWLLAGGLVA